MVKEQQIFRIKNATQTKTADVLAVEEPLEISLNHSNAVQSTISVTMRTPGNDEELAVGFLFTEGIIFSRNHLAEEKIHEIPEDNKITIFLSPDFNPALNKLERNFYTTSSCGVCGKNSIDAIKQVCRIENNQTKIVVEAAEIFDLPLKLRKAQEMFESTGGIHASATFDLEGNLETLQEDVGRHNALDKLIGAEFLKQEADCFTLQDKILLLSGRASFELIQKAAMAGVQIVCAIGAPSSLAVETARDFGMTLIGFLKNESCNIYCGEERVNL